MKRFLSYLFPIQLKKVNSPINGQIEVKLVDGKKLLDTQNSNYSYGSLQKILHYGLKKINFNNDIKRILVLGLGGGSIIQTIREKFKSNAYIEAVEIDPIIIEISKNVFDIDRFDNLNIVQADANEYLLKCKNTFDLIVVDLFIVDTIPEKFTQQPFLYELKKHLNHQGYIIYNTMKQTMTADVFNKIVNTFKKESNFLVKVYNNVEVTNNLIIVHKN